MNMFFEKKKNLFSNLLPKIGVEFLHASSARLFSTKFKSVQDWIWAPDRVSRWTEFGVDCIFVKQSASISLVPTWRAPLLQEERFQLECASF